MSDLVIGLDTNSYGFHWAANQAIYDLDDVGHLVGFAKCRDDNVEVRRAMTYGSAKGFFAQLPHNSHVFCEEPLALKNGKTTRILSLAAGAIWAAFQEAVPNAWWHWVDVASWKKEVIGNGNASKERIREWVLESPGFKIDFNRDPGSMALLFDAERDLYDAWSIKLYGVKALAHG